MKLTIPFYINNEDSNQCGQVAMKSVLKHVLNKEYALSELDKLSGRKKGQWTSSAQIASSLYNEGLNLVLYTNTDLNIYLKKSGYIKKNYSHLAFDKKHSQNLQAIQRAVNNLNLNGIIKKHQISVKSIKSHIEAGHIPIVLVDYNKLNHRIGSYQGHFVVITNIDKSNVYYHESGPFEPKAHKKSNISAFAKAMNADGTDNYCIIILGKRQTCNL